MQLTKKTSLVRACGAALALVIVGCGGSGNGITAPPADPFVGTWTYDTGSIAPMCNLTLSDFDLTGDTVTIDKTDASHISMMISATGLMCDVSFTVSGSTATVESGQTCSFTESEAGETITAVLKVSSWTMTLAAGKIMTSLSGTASATVAGIPINCTPSGSGTLSKTSDGGASG